VSETVIGYSAGSLSTLGFMFSLTAALILIAAWVILATSRFVQGGVVERPERIPQLYGYTVCLFALIWGLTSALSIVEDALSLSAPELRGSPEFAWAEPSITSFEAFRATYDRARRMGAPDARDAQLDSVPEPELRRRYEALRADRIRRARVETHRELITGTLSLIVAAVLFAWHWGWLRRRVGAPAA
jgi:hypothetical protein